MTILASSKAQLSESAYPEALEKHQDYALV
jgi:hypothetical protein